MPRKKKVSKKNNSTNTTLKLVQEIEMDLLEIPTQLANQLDKEISTLTTKATKLETAINKLTVQIEKKSKSNSKAGKKAVAKCLKEQTVLNKELQEVSSSIDTLKTKQAKFIALRKHLGQFEKEWSKQVKAMKEAQKAKARKKTTPVAKKQSKTSAAESSIIEIDNSVGNTQQDQELENTGS